MVPSLAESYRRILIMQSDKAGNLVRDGVISGTNAAREDS